MGPSRSTVILWRLLGKSAGAAAARCCRHHVRRVRSPFSTASRPPATQPAARRALPVANASRTLRRARPCRAAAPRDRWALGRAMQPGGALRETLRGRRAAQCAPLLSVFAPGRLTRRRPARPCRAACAPCGGAPSRCCTKRRVPAARRAPQQPQRGAGRAIRVQRRLFGARAALTRRPAPARRRAWRQSRCTLTLRRFRCAPPLRARAPASWAETPAAGCASRPARAQPPGLAAPPGFRALTRGTRARLAATAFGD